MKLWNLVGHPGGLVSEVVSMHSAADDPTYIVSTALTGDLREAWSQASLPLRMSHGIVSLNGSGTGLSESEAFVPAIAESVERYCTTLFNPEQFTIASAEAMGDQALDLGTIPRCSEAELSHHDCPLRAPSNTEKVRWVGAVDLLQGKLKYVPAVMVYLYLKPMSNAERIWLPITTGCAAHCTYEEALLGGLLELVERDALSLSWLQRMALPRINLEVNHPDLVTHTRVLDSASAHLENRFFNATGELGVPTVYGIQRSLADPNLTTVVSCASACTIAKATAKVFRDLVATRMYLRSHKSFTREWRKQTSLPQSAAYMAAPEQSSAFDHIWHSERRQELTEIPSIVGPSIKHQLRQILARCRREGMNVYAVDLSSDEAIRAGMRVVKVLIPELQPFSFDYRARYLGHPRLYTAPPKWGYTAFPEEGLNTFPQPFA